MLAMIVKQTTRRAALAGWIATAALLPVQLQAQETSKVSSTSRGRGAAAACQA
jgi:hypothetical protein